MSEEKGRDAHGSPAARLRELLQAEMTRFDLESRKHKSRHRTAELCVIVFSATTTVIAGLGLVLPGQAQGIQFAVLVTSSVGTAVTSWASARRFRDLWHHEREVYYALKDIVRELDFRTAVEVLEVDDVKEIFHRASSILGASAAKWSRIVELKQAAPSTPV